MADHLTLLDSPSNPAGDVVAPQVAEHQDGQVQQAQLAVEQRFAVVPEWMLESTVSDTAFRLYAVLARYGNTSGVRMPGRALLARRLHRSVDTVDRALKELTAAGILSVERRHAGGRTLTNRYHLRTHDPDTPAGCADGQGRSPAALPQPNSQVEEVGAASGGRTGAAPTPADIVLTGGDEARWGRRRAAPPSRTTAARWAAAVRPNPDVPTETPPPPTAPAPGDGIDVGGAETPGTVEDTAPTKPDPGSGAALLAGCRIGDLDAYAATVQGLRRDVGQPSVRWSAPCLLAAMQFAVKVRGWPAAHVRDALLLVAADPNSRSPMRLAEAGPWWDHAERPGLTRTRHEQDELNGLEATLADADDRATLQRQAREQLAADGEPVTRLTVARRACRLLEQQTSRPLTAGPHRPGRAVSTPLPAQP